MKLKLNRIKSPFVMELTNESGDKCVMDANPSIGGTGAGFRPMELLAGSLAGCVSIDVLNILKKQRIELVNYSIEIEAKRKVGIPSPFENIHLNFEFNGDVLEEKIRKIIDLTLEKYCSVSASLDKAIQISYSIKINP